MIASTAYLDLFLRSVSETSLLKTFLRFILLHRHDNDTILDTLLTRISSNSRVYDMCVCVIEPQGLYMNSVVWVVRGLRAKTD